MSKPGPPEIILNKRKGFIKMALQLGVDLVPVFGFGEHEIWDQGEQPKEGTLGYKFNSWLTSKTGAGKVKRFKENLIQLKNMCQLLTFSQFYPHSEVAESSTITKACCHIGARFTR